MQKARFTWGAALAAAALALAAPDAHAGAASLFVGPLYVDPSDFHGCSALNVSTKTLTGVTVYMREADGTLASTLGCGELAPSRSCPASLGGSPSEFGWFSCEAISDQGAKGLRVTIVNQTAGTALSAP